MSENLTVGKKKPNTEDFIDLCSETLINNTIALNEIEKSSDKCLHILRLNLTIFTFLLKHKKIISFYCTACGHTNRMLTEDINQILIKKMMIIWNLIQIIGKKSVNFLQAKEDRKVLLIKRSSNR